MTPVPGAAQSNIAATAPLQQPARLSSPVAVKAPGAEPATTPSNIVTSSGPWKWLTLGLALLWLATVAAWVITHRRRRAGKNTAPSANEPRSPPSTSAARAAFLAACEANDPQAARRNLLSWVNAMQQPGPRIIGLNALEKITGDASLTDLLRNLDRACYTADPWQGAALASAMQRWSFPIPHTDIEPRNKLAPLYR